MTFCWCRRLLGQVGAVLALGATLTSAAWAQQKELTPIRFRLDWVWQAPQSLWTLAHERGYFRDEGLDVTIDRGYGGLDNAAALASGTYEFLFGDINNVILFNAKSTAQKLISVLVVYDGYLGSVIARKGSGITKPKDLEGKTIGAPLTTGGRTMFPAFATANGIDESKINWQTINIQLQDQQFAQGQFDAIASFVTTSVLNLKQLGMARDKLEVFNFSDHGVDLFGFGLVVRSDYMASNPEIINKFIRATLRGLKAMLENKAEAIQSLKKRDPLLNVGIELERLDLTIEMALRRPGVERFGVGHVDPARLRRNIDTIATVFKLPQAPKPEDVHTDKFLPPASERMLKF